MVAPVLAQIHQNYPTDVRIVYRHFPLPQHDKSLLAAQAVEAAGLQGKFWELHDVIFKDQASWSNLSVADFTTWLSGQAVALGLDKDKFASDLQSQPIVDKVKKAQQDAETAGINSTPTLIINGRLFPEGLPKDYDTITSIIKLIQMEDRQFTSCPPMTIDPKKTYIATLKTAKGDIVIQLLPDKAPMTVNSFVFLAQKGWFNGATFHRVLPNFIAQTGDPSGTGFGGPGYAFGNEISDLKFDQEGVVGMANAGADSNGSQFFITYAAAPQLDGQYTIFGRVIQGMDVVKKLTPRNPNPQPGDPTPTGGVLPPGDRIDEITVVEK